MIPVLFFNASQIACQAVIQECDSLLQSYQLGISHISYLHTLLLELNSGTLNSPMRLACLSHLSTGGAKMFEVVILIFCSSYFAKNSG